MDSISAEVIIHILEFLHLKLRDIYTLRLVSRTFNKACRSPYFIKSKSFDRFRPLFPNIHHASLPLRTIGSLDPEKMMKTELVEKIYETYHPYLPEKFKKVSEKPMDILTRFLSEKKISNDCFQRLSKFQKHYDEYENKGGLIDFTFFTVHPYTPLLLTKPDQSLNHFIHKLAIVKFFEPFPEIKNPEPIKREEEVIESMNEGRKLETHRFIDPIFLTDRKEILENTHYVYLDKMDKPITSSSFTQKEPWFGPKDEDLFWPNIHNSDYRNLKRLHCCDLIALCSEPPYGFSDDKEPTPNETGIRESLWSSFEDLDDLDIVVWANMNSSWAQEFEGGTNWWGNYLISYYVKSLNLMIIGYGNATD